MSGTEISARPDESASGLTFVIPVWDHYVRLLETVYRRLKDEIPDAHFVVVDNASTLSLPKLDAAFVRLTVRRSTGAARNAALPMLTTPFVCFFDADDLPVPGSLAGLLALANASSDTVAAAGTGIAWHPATRERVDIGFSDRVLSLQRHRRIFGLISVVRNRYATVGSVLRTSAVRDAGGFSDLNYCEDWGLATSLAFRGRVRLVQRAAFLSRIHVGSMINREGTPAGIIRSLFPLYRRWLLDAAIPVWLKPLFLLTPTVRLKQAFVRWRSKTRSHDDLFDRIGRYRLDETDPESDQKTEPTLEQK